MNFEQLKNLAKFYSPLVTMEKVLSHKNRKFFERAFFYLTVMISFLSLGIFFEVNDRLLGTLLLSGSMWSLFFVLESFFYSHYFKSEKSVLGGSEDIKMPYELAEVILRADENHITQSFLESKIGQSILIRLGISKDEIEEFFSKRKDPLSSDEFVLKQNNLSLGSFVGAIMENDKEFSQFLLSKNIKKEDVIGCSDWVERMYHARKKYERWWNIDNMARAKGIGKKWAYGMTYSLEQYGRDILPRVSSASFDLYKDEINEIEAVLAKSDEANALLVSEYGRPNLDIINGLAKEIEEGTVLTPLEHKRIVSLDYELLIANNGSKNALENEIIKVMNEAVKAGNVIILIDDLVAFVASAYAVGVNVMDIIDDYIAGSYLQVISLSDKNGFEKYLRVNETVVKRFEVIKVAGIDEKALLRILLDRALYIESKQKIFFTFQSLRAIVTSAERYYMDGSPEDKVADFLSELAPRMEMRKQILVLDSDVYEMVTEKTGIPVGEATVSEKEKLSNLEDIISKRVIGQKEAVKAISDALRRNRSGISSQNRPIGSFLFLGPTGVGKTETSKALAEALFGSSKKLLRLDMSEYNTPDAINRLIGSLSGDKGVLTTLIRENPHGVLLLDEFEKTDPEVLNLFLQILDEGVFADALGTKVNARNMLFIATTNAGSDLLWEYTKNGQNISQKKTEIIDEIIKRKSFKPELLNRFDGVILFHPLSDAQLRDIAKIMLEKLGERLRDQGINFVVTEEAIDILVKEGSDPQFGARPLNRAIQDKIESAVARDIMNGDLQAGMTYEFKG